MFWDSRLPFVGKQFGLHFVLFSVLDANASRREQMVSIEAHIKVMFKWILLANLLLETF